MLKLSAAIDQLRELLATNFLTDSVDSFYLLSTFTTFNMWSTISKAGRGGAILCSLFRNANFDREVFPAPALSGKNVIPSKFCNNFGLPGNLVGPLQV